MTQPRCEFASDNGAGAMPEALEALVAAVYRFLDSTVRFMCSWATTPELVDELGEALKAIAWAVGEDNDWQRGFALYPAYEQG